MKTHFETLKNCMDTHEEFHMMLVQVKLLKYTQIADILGCSVCHNVGKYYYKQNEALLNHLLQTLKTEAQFKEYLHVLAMSSQQHVAKFLRMNGGKNQCFSINCIVVFIYCCFSSIYIHV